MTDDLDVLFNANTLGYSRLSDSCIMSLSLTPSHTHALNIVRQTLGYI